MRPFGNPFRVFISLLLGCLGLVALAPVAHAVSPVDDVVVVQAGSWVEVDVLANDGANPSDYVKVAAPVDARVSDGAANMLYVDLYGTTSGGSFSVGYQVHSEDGDAVGPVATLTVHVVPTTARTEFTNSAAAIQWPGLPTAITGARISYATDYIFGHDSASVIDTLTMTGPPPWNVPNLVNGQYHYLYVTPRAGSAELAQGMVLEGTPRATNTAPEAVDDQVSLVTPGVIDFFPQDNDQDADGDLLRVTSVTQPASGSVSCDGYACTYATGPNPVSGAISYTISDGHGGTDSANVHFVKRSVSLVADTFTNLYADEPVTIDVRGNDSGLLPSDEIWFSFEDPEISVVEEEPGQAVVLANTPGVYEGSYSAVTETGEELGTAAISLTVVPRRGLAAIDDVATTDMGLAVRADVGVNDWIAPEDFPLNTTTTRITNAPDSGTATMSFQVLAHDEEAGPVMRNLPVINYTPHAGFLGTDSLTYAIVDAQGDTDTATLEIEVSADGAYPVVREVGVDSALLDLDYSGSSAVDEVQVCYAVGSRSADPGPVPDRENCAHPVNTSALPASVSLVSLTPDLWHSVTVWTHYDDGTAAGVWSPGQSEFFHPGVSPVSSPWAEAGGTSATVSWQNPVQGPLSNASTGTVIGWSSASAPTQPGSGTGWTTVGAGDLSVQLTGLSADTTYHYAIFATVSAKGSWATPVHGAFRTRASNSAPNAVDDSVEVFSNVATQLNVLDNDTDADNDELTIRANSEPAHGELECGQGFCLYEPDADYLGPDSFTYTISDARNGSDTATVGIRVVDQDGVVPPVVPPNPTPPTPPKPAPPTGPILGPVSPPGAPVISLTIDPKVRGKVKVGKRLLVTPGGYAPKSVRVSYQWLRSGKVIGKATKSAYKLTRRDRGKKISVRVTYTLSGAATVVRTIRVKGKVKG